METEIQSDVSLSCDETLMSRLITNLLTNAIRYNRPGGRIQVSLKMTEVSNRESREGGMSQEQKADQEQHGAIPAAIIQVSDTGIGIPKEKLPKIWDRFYRADSLQKQRRAPVWAFPWSAGSPRSMADGSRRKARRGMGVCLRFIFRFKQPLKWAAVNPMNFIPIGFI